MSSPILSLTGVEKIFGGLRAIGGVSFDVQEKQIYGLIGPNGAGKSTLFLCLAGILKPSSGSLRVCGLNPSDAKDRKQLPAQLGIVFQDADDQLFSSTLQDDVAFGPLNLGLSADEVRTRVHDSLNRVGLPGFEDRVPFQLSGGEKRRAALAGVLAMRPSVLLMDEPSMFLDARGRRGLIELIRDWQGTQVIASHDLRLIAETCRRVLVMDEGRIAVAGETETILADRELLLRHGLEA